MRQMGSDGSNDNGPSSLAYCVETGIAVTIAAKHGFRPPTLQVRQRSQRKKLKILFLDM